MRPAYLATLMAVAAAPALADGHAPRVTTSDWSGVYIGGQLDGFGYLDEVNAFTGAFVSDYDLPMAGVFAGFRHDFGDIVLGGEIDIMSGTADRQSVGLGVIVSVQDAEMEVVRVGAEVGYDLGNFLAYGSAGYAQATFNYGPGFPPFTATGQYYGVGLDYRATDTITVGAELFQHQFDLGLMGAADYELTTFGVNIAYTF